MSHEESYGHFYDTENPDQDGSSQVEYVVLYSETHYKVCKKVWCRDTSKYRIYYAPLPYSNRRTSSKEKKSRDARVGISSPTSKYNASICETIQATIGVLIIVGYVVIIGLYAKL